MKQSVKKKPVKHHAPPVVPGEKISQQLSDLLLTEAPNMETEDWLREQNAFIAAIIDAADLLVVVLNHNGQMVLFNRACETLTGYQTDAVVGKCIWDVLLVPEEIKPVKKIFGELKKEHLPSRFTNYWLTKKGDRRLIAWSNTVIFDDKNAVKYVIGTGVDITEQRKTEQALKKNEGFLSSVFSSIQDGISVLDNELNIIQVNPVMEKWYAHSIPLVGKKCYVAYHGRSTPCEICPTRQTIASGKLACEVVPKRGPQGKIEGWLDLYSFPLVDMVTGNKRGVIEYVRDITLQKQAEEKLANLSRVIQQTDDNVVITNKDGIIEYINEAFERISGYSNEEIIGKPAALLKSGQTEKGILDQHLKAVTAGKVFHGIMIKKKKNGEIYYEESTITPLRDSQGNITHYALTGKDITKRKKTEEMLQHSERQYRTMIEYANDLIWTVDTNGNFTFTNPQALRVTGHRFEDWIGKSFAPLVHPDDLPMVQDVFRKTLSGKPQQYTASIYNKNGAVIILAVNTAPIYDKDKVIGTVSFGRDITSRKLMEDALHQSEKRYRTLAEAANDMIYIVDFNGVVQYANNFSANTLNSRAIELVGKQLGELFPKETSDGFINNIRKVFDTGEPFYVRAQTSFPGKKMWLGTWLAPIKNAAKKVTAVMGISRDITAQKQTEDILQENEEKYRILIKNIQDGVFVIQDAKLQFVNEAFAKIVGYTVDELIGMDFRSLIAPEDLEMTTERYFKRQSGESVPREYEFRALHKDGQTRIAVNMTVGLITYQGRVASMGTIKNITDRKRVEEELQKSFNRLHTALEGAVNTLSSIAEKRDPYTAGHQQMVTKLSLAIAQELNLPKEQVNCIRVAALLHDIGKISIPAEILSKPGQMTETEMTLIKIHAQAGHDILKTIDFQWPIAQIILQHHERMNGSGYPQGLTSDKICLEAKIISVADVVDSMSSHRPYRPVVGIDDALEEITKNRGTLYDPAVVDACLRLFKEKGFKLE